MVGAVYNPSFHCICSCNVSKQSAVFNWSMEGALTHRFTKAHGSSAITCLQFDKQGRRLFTGCHRGDVVRCWNFSNGCLIKELVKVPNDEIKSGKEPATPVGQSTFGIEDDFLTDQDIDKLLDEPSQVNYKSSVFSSALDAVDSLVLREKESLIITEKSTFRLSPSSRKRSKKKKEKESRTEEAELQRHSKLVRVPYRSRIRKQRYALTVTLIAEQTCTYYAWPLLLFPFLYPSSPLLIISLFTTEFKPLLKSHIKTTKRKKLEMKPVAFYTLKGRPKVRKYSVLSQLQGGIVGFMFTVTMTKRASWKED